MLPDDGRNILRDAAPLNAFVHDVVNSLRYEHRTSKGKYFYVNILHTYFLLCLCPELFWQLLRQNQENLILPMS